MINDTIFNCVEEGKSVLIYKEDVYKFLPDLKSRWITIFVSGPTPPKQRLMDIASKLGFETKDKLKRKTIEDLKQLLKDKTRNKKVVIMFNNFEKLTESATEVWGFLNNLESIVIVAGYNKNFKDAAYGLFQTMVHIKQEMHEEIDIKFSLFAILTALCVFAYMKIASVWMSLSAFTLIATIWLGLIIFRTFIFLGK